MEMIRNGDSQMSLFSIVSLKNSVVDQLCTWASVFKVAEVFLESTVAYEDL